MPLLNLQDYTGPQLAFYATGAYLWVVAYLIYIRNGFKYRVVEMPAFAACSNIGWEVNWALLFTSDLGTLSVWAHKAWRFEAPELNRRTRPRPLRRSGCRGPYRGDSSPARLARDRGSGIGLQGRCTGAPPPGAPWVFRGCRRP